MGAIQCCITDEFDFHQSSNSSLQSLNTQKTNQVSVIIEEDSRMVNSSHNVSGLFNKKPTYQSDDLAKQLYESTDKLYQTTNKQTIVLGQVVQLRNYVQKLFLYSHCLKRKSNKNSNEVTLINHSSINEVYLKWKIVAKWEGDILVDGNEIELVHQLTDKRLAAQFNHFSKQFEISCNNESSNDSKWQVEQLFNEEEKEIYMLLQNCFNKFFRGSFIQLKHQSSQGYLAVYNKKAVIKSQILVSLVFNQEDKRTIWQLVGNE